MSRGRCSHWGMMPEGETSKLGGSLTKRQGNRVKKPLLTKSSISSRRKGLCSWQDWCDPRLTRCVNSFLLHGVADVTTGTPFLAQLVSKTDAV